MTGDALPEREPGPKPMVGPLPSVDHGARTMMQAHVMTQAFPSAGVFDPDESVSVPGRSAQPGRDKGAATERFLFAQSMRYVDDLVKVYELEKTRTQALEQANDRLTVEMEARRRAERSLRLQKRQFERELAERTRELETANAALQAEMRRRTLLENHLKESLRRKESQLLETQHRVKNDLQVVSSLLSLHATRSRDEGTLAALAECRDRVRAMALAHEQLCGSKTVTDVNFPEYVRSLINLICETHRKPGRSVNVKIDCAPEPLHVSQAVPCGLIINELVTNCFMHAFGGRPRGEIHISFVVHAANRFVLTVSDTGSGFPSGLDVKAGKALGLKLVTNLAELQLAGSIRLENENGAKITVEFPARKPPSLLAGPSDGQSGPAPGLL
jgi:two-component sensor histidine kinase